MVPHRHRDCDQRTCNIGWRRRRNAQGPAYEADHERDRQTNTRSQCCAKCINVAQAGISRFAAIYPSVTASRTMDPRSCGGAGSGTENKRQPMPTTKPKQRPRIDSNKALTARHAVNKPPCLGCHFSISSNLRYSVANKEAKHRVNLAIVTSDPAFLLNTLRRSIS
jgi:hypothetical protein